LNFSHSMHLQRRSLLQSSSALALGLPGLIWGQTHTAALPPALVIGNTSYNPNDENLPPASKCVKDLQLQLQRLGYGVVALLDPAVAQIKTELDALQQRIKTHPEWPAVFYFVGHGFQSNAENFLVPAGGDLKRAPADLARLCVSLEKDVFTRLKRPLGPAATVIMVDTCRTPDRPRSAGEGYNQTLPPEGCHVVFATGPGKRAFAPNNPDLHTLFTDVLLGELGNTQASQSVFLTLEAVRFKVTKKVNSIAAIVRAFGANAQQPEVASHVLGDPVWLPAALSSAGAASAAASSASQNASPAQARGAEAELQEIQTLTSPEEAITRLKAWIASAAATADATELAQQRLSDLEKVARAARLARLPLTDEALKALSAQPRVQEDARRARRGDKYAALRVAESFSPPVASEILIERSDYGRWMVFAAHLGNGIAAYRLSLHFRNVDRRDTEATRFLNLAISTQYTPPRQLDVGR
jgi:Caspase domain